MKKTLTLLIALIFVVGIILFVNSNKNSKTKAGYQPFSGIIESGISNITIARASKISKLVKEGDKWYSLNPEKYPADEEKIKRAIDYLAKQKLRSPISNNPDNYDKFKLDSLSLTRVTIKGKKDITFDIGAMNKGYGGNFIRIKNKEEVYVSIGGALFNFSSDDFYYREKSFIKANKDSVVSVKLSYKDSKDSPINLVVDYNKTANTWSVNGNKIGDPSKINSFIGSIVSLRCNDWYSKDDNTDKKFENPYMTINIKTENQKEFNVIFGAESSNKLYTKLSTDNIRYFVNKYEVDRLKKIESDLEGKIVAKSETPKNLNSNSKAQELTGHEGHNH